MKQLLATLLALIASAIRTQREDNAKVSDIKSQVDELDLEDEHKDQVNEVINLSLAARPPTEDQLSLVTNGPLSQDPAQPKGSPAPGNPDAEERAKKTRPRAERIEDLVDGNTHEELVTKAEEAGVEFKAHDSKTVIATAIVDKEDESAK